MQKILRTLSLENEIVNILTSINAKNILLLTFEHIIISNIISDIHSIKHVKFSTGLLTTDEVEKLKKKVSFNYDTIISIGGGTVIDCAKILKNDSKNDKLIHIAIPSTAGSGSESTAFAVMYSGLQKLSISASKLLPDYVILCPALVQTLPRQIKISSGLDALAQSIESSWSINANEESLSYSLKALRLVQKHFRTFVLENNLDSATQMQDAANYAGKAINITKTTLPHALSYYLTAKFGIPHGIAVFLTLPTITSKNPLRSELLEVFGVSTSSGLTQILNNYLKEFGISPRLSDHGLTESDLSPMIEASINSGRFGNNPWQATREELKTLLKELL